MVVSQGQGAFRDGFWICQDSFAGTVARRFGDRGVLVLGGTNDSCADEPNLKVELLKLLSLFWEGTLFSFCSKTIFTASLCQLCFFFFVRHSEDPSNRLLLPFPSHFVVFAVLSHVHALSFFEPTGLFNLCKAGISWTPRNVVSFLFIYPQNKTPSSRQSSGPRRTASSGVASLPALLLCICGLQAQVRIKVFICFTVGSHGFFFPPTVAGSYPTPGVSVRSSQCLAEVGDAEI